MVTTKWIRVAALLWLPAMVLAQAPPAAVPVAAPANDAARLLAGLEPLQDAAALAVTERESWQRHARTFDAAWERLEKRQLSKVRNWAGRRMPEAFAATGTAYYMFSGPDFLYADTFFPQARTYIMCGIEPVGPLPEPAKLAPPVLGGELNALRESLESMLSFSFFITKEMKQDLQNHPLSGTLPLIYIFLARTGKTIHDVSYVAINGDGTLSPCADPRRTAACPAPGVRIVFVAEGARAPQTLYYFSTDISDSGLRQSGFLKFCAGLAPGVSCVKSASYLMHEKPFSSVREFLLDHSQWLVQDDSGIPCRFFDPDRWDLRYFGSYPGPIPLFKEYTQPRLSAVYQEQRPQPLEFGIGYRHRAGESILMVAGRKTTAGTADGTPPAAPPRAVVVPEDPAAPPPAS